MAEKEKKEFFPNQFIRTLDTENFSNIILQLVEMLKSVFTLENPQFILRFLPENIHAIPMSRQVNTTAETAYLDEEVNNFFHTRSDINIEIHFPNGIEIEIEASSVSKLIEGIYHITHLRYNGYDFFVKASSNGKIVVNTTYGISELDQRVLERFEREFGVNLAEFDTIDDGHQQVLSAMDTTFPLKVREALILEEKPEIMTNRALTVAEGITLFEILEKNYTENLPIKANFHSEPIWVKTAEHYVNKFNPNGFYLQETYLNNSGITHVIPVPLVNEGLELHGWALVELIVYQGRVKIMANRTEYKYRNHVLRYKEKKDKIDSLYKVEMRLTHFLQRLLEDEIIFQGHEETEISNELVKIMQGIDIGEYESELIDFLQAAILAFSMKPNKIIKNSQAIYEKIAASFTERNDSFEATTLEFSSLLYAILWQGSSYYTQNIDDLLGKLNYETVMTGFIGSIDRLVNTLIVSLKQKGKYYPISTLFEMKD